MSKVKVQGNASGTGVFTVESPNSDTDRTLTLPDAAGTLLTSDGDGSNLTGISGGKVVQVVQYTETTNYTTTSSSEVQGPQTGTFTLTNSSNKVFVVADHLSWTNGAKAEYYLYRGSIASGTKLNGGNHANINSGSGVAQYTMVSHSWLDTPGGNTTYSISLSGSNTHLDGAYRTTTITMMEIEV